MKKITLSILFLYCSLSYAQVGIGTTNPQADLHVGGEMLIQDSFKLNSLNTVGSTEENFKLITRLSNSTPVGQITALDVNNLSVAPVNIIEYTFTNISLDNLRDLDLQYDSSKYIVGIANFRYMGDPIDKSSTGSGSMSIGQFVVRTFESGGTWHLEIQNRSLDLAVSDSVQYYATLIIYDKSYYKKLPAITTNLGGSNTGTASVVPTLN